jgi:hypothetical protein
MTTEKLVVQLAVVCRAQALRLERQQAELKIVRERNRQLRGRVVRLSRSRDQWRERATQYRPLVNRLRSRAAYYRLSRDVWKVRAGKARAAEGEATAALVRVPPERYASDVLVASRAYHG